jgi:hypothetical protein
MAGLACRGSAFRPSAAHPCRSGRVANPMQPHIRALFVALGVATSVAACGSRAPRIAPRHTGGPSAANLSSANAGDVWIRDVTLVSSERAESLPHAHVLLRGERIAWVSAAPPPDVGSGAIEVNGTGRFLVPGLIDGHVHLAEVPGATREQLAAMPSVADRYFQQLPRSYLYFGFTAVVDLNVVDQKRVASIRAAPLAPTVFDCGNGLALANGYPMSFLPPEQRFALYPNFVYDPRQAAAIPKAYAPSEHAPAASVARRALPRSTPSKSSSSKAASSGAPSSPRVRPCRAPRHRGRSTSHLSRASELDTA